MSRIEMGWVKAAAFCAGYSGSEKSAKGKVILALSIEIISTSTF
jgi:hypothetical protein